MAFEAGWAWKGSGVVKEKLCGSEKLRKIPFDMIWRSFPYQQTEKPLSRCS